MSWLSDRLGIHLGNIGAPIGAALGSFIPGVGTALGAGLGQAVGGIGSGEKTLPALLKGGAVYGGAKLLGGSNPFGGSGSTDPNAQGGWSGFLRGALGRLGGSAIGSLGGLASGALGAAGNALGVNGQGYGGQSGGGGTNPLILGLAGLQAANAASLGKKSNDYATNAFKSVNNSYTQRAGLRDAGISGMLHPQTPDLSGLTAIRNQLPGIPVGAAAGIPALQNQNPQGVVS